MEGESGKLEVIFEEPEEVKFVVSPNTPIREIWISALSTSFKLAWSEAKNAFVLEKTGRGSFCSDEPRCFSAARHAGQTMKFAAIVLVSILLPGWLRCGAAIGAAAGSFAEGRRSLPQPMFRSSIL